MLYRGKHNVSRDGLLARKSVMTATELTDLISKYESGKKAKRADTQQKYKKAFMDLLYCLGAEKTSTGEVDITAPSIDAARGHILEPYAIQQWNKGKTTEELMYHGDDCLVVDNKKRIGFSPDGLDIPRTTDDVVLEGINPKKIIEIKSYGIKHHTQCILSIKEELKERWQIAMAMYVCPSIESGINYFYCPNARQFEHYAEGTRDELEQELKAIDEIVDLGCGQWQVLDKTSEKAKPIRTENEIYQIGEAEQDE